MIDLIQQFLHFIGSLDERLVEWVCNYQTLTYLILALIIFCETGLVVTPFLPGDSLLFAAGAVCAMDASSANCGISENPMNVWWLIPLLFMAALLGDNTNYFFGKFLGEKVFTRDYWFLKRKYLDRTSEFYEQHGGKTLVIARFVPIVRTFAPFVAGVGAMTYRKFIGFCIAGGLLWVTSLTLAGYFLGSHPFVKKNFEIVIFGIIGVSVMPMVIEFARSHLIKKG